MRYSLYSSCGRDKLLSEAGKFYLHYLARMQSSYLAVFVRQRLSYRARRFKFCTALWSRYAHHPAFAVRCRYRYRVRRVCITVLALRQSVRSFACRTRRRRLKFYVRRPVYRSMSSLGTARLSCFACATWRRSKVYALAPARSASFTKRASRSVRCVPLNFKI